MIQVIIDERLLIEVDRTIEELGITRSAFIRDALQLALWQHRLLWESEISLRILLLPSMPTIGHFYSAPRLPGCPTRAA
jgi:metal-responsive CopG/Arc/MetJ family transcriptional regulator